MIFNVSNSYYKGCSLKVNHNLLLETKTRIIMMQV